MGSATPVNGLEDVSLDNQEWKNSTTPVVTNGQQPSRFDVEVGGCAITVAVRAAAWPQNTPPAWPAFTNQPFPPSEASS